MNSHYFHYYCYYYYYLGPLKTDILILPLKVFQHQLRVKGSTKQSGCLPPLTSQKRLQKWDGIDIWFRDSLWSPKNSVPKISFRCWPLFGNAGQFDTRWAKAWRSLALLRGEQRGPHPVCVITPSSSASLMRREKHNWTLQITWAKHSWCPEGGRGSNVKWYK